LSILPHIINLDVAKTTSGDVALNPLEALPVGFVVEAAKVIEVLKDQGVYVDIGLEDINGFVHVHCLKKTSDGRYLSFPMTESTQSPAPLDLSKYPPYTEVE
jgi:hypothetical protein